jgi:hypothetical protein
MSPKGRRLHIQKVHVNFNWIGDGDHWRSILGILFHLGSSPIFYNTKIQSFTATSLTEAKIQGTL